MRTPEDAQHLSCLVACLRDHGQRDEAGAAIDAAVDARRAAVRLRPDNAGARLSLGITLRDQGKLAEAAAELREAIRLRPGLGEARHILATTLRDQGKAEEAAEVFREMIRLRPGTVGFHHANTISLSDIGRVNSHFAAGLLAPRVEPSVALRSRGRGTAYAHLGRWREARGELGRALEAEPSDHLLWFIVALLDLQLGDIESYRRHCLGMLDRFESTADPLVIERVSRVCLLDPRPHEGWARAQRLAGRAAPRMAVWLGLSQSLAAYRDGRSAEAIDRARPQIAAGAYFDILRELLLATASQREGRPGEAALWLDLARRTIAARVPTLDVETEDESWQTPLQVRLFLGEADQVVRGGPGDAPKAEQAPPRGVRLRAELTAGYAGLADYLRSRGRLDEADHLIREAVRLKPEDAGLSFQVGELLLAWGRLDEAAEAFREAIRLRPALAEAHCELGRVLRKGGRFAEALQEFRRGHELGSGQSGWFLPSGAWVRDSERVVAVIDRLPGGPEGGRPPARCRRPLGPGAGLLRHGPPRRGGPALDRR